MKISHESPLSLLKQSRQYNDYDYALVHLFEENEEYYDFFVKSLDMGRHVLLDNSIFELGTAFDSVRYAYWIDKLEPTEYIIPDSLENAMETMNNATEWVEKYSNLPGKKIGVVQGKNYDQLIQCYKYMENVIEVDKIAISFDYSYYLDVAKHPNQWVGYALGRVATLTRMMNEGIINKNIPHHLLGCSLPVEFMFYREGFEWIETMDTSNPVVHGLLGIDYEPGGLVNKKSIKLVDLLDSVPSNDQMLAINNNIKKFRTYVNGM